MEFHSLKDVLQEQLEDLHSAETQLIAALPKMAQAAHHDQLREALETHLEETKGHLKRVKEALSEIGVGTPTEVCMGMKGLITEGEEMIQTEGDPNAKDVALIGAAQRVEHYEIAAYGTVATWAEGLGYTDAAELLRETLDEEKTADETLTGLAEAGINAAAGGSAPAAGRARTAGRI
jgi:ferritin-like metal-binding protein YciE